MLTLILGIALGLVSFYMRVKPRLSQRNFGIDTWYYLLYADVLRNNKKLPAKLPYFLLDIDEQWYPPVLPILLSFLPKRFLEKFQWALSPFIDTLQMVLLYFAGFFLTKNLWIASFSAVLYATSPILVSQNSNLNSRSLGALVFTIVILMLCQYISTAHLLYLIIAILSGALLLFTHKLATQQMFFLFIIFSILFSNPVYLLILAGIYIVVFVFSGRFYLKVFRGHIGILKFWRKNLPYRHQIYNSPFYANEKKAEDKRGSTGIPFNKVWYLLARFQFVFIFSAVVIYSFLNRHYLNSIDIFILTWLLVNYMTVVLITYFKPVKFLGEGYRYSVYGVFPASFMLSRFIFFEKSHIYIGFIVMLVIVIVNMFLINKVHSDQKKNMHMIVDNDLFEIIHRIKNLPKDNIMCFPVSYCEPIAYFCRKKVLWGAHSYGYDKLEPFFPILLKPIEHFVKFYSISYCLINKEYVSLEDLNLSVSYRVLFEKEKYCLLEF